jgi:hypothetical protein
MAETECPSTWRSGSSSQKYILPDVKGDPVQTPTTGLSTGGLGPGVLVT